MKPAGLPILTFALLAGCATSTAPDGRAALVGQPLTAAVEAIGYLPDEVQETAGLLTYVWQLGAHRKFNSPADSRNTGSPMHSKCTVEVTTDRKNVIRDVALEETRGGCAPVNRKLRLAAS